MLKVTGLAHRSLDFQSLRTQGVGRALIPRPEAEVWASSRWAASGRGFGTHLAL